MSGEKASSPCRKFQANIFNKSKCQNCFKSRELHLPTDRHMEQAKPIYGGWLCLAPVGTDFDNPLQRSRKWQRRFFILYEDGSLSFALDELPSTLPQGTINMNLCTDITDAEPRTSQRNGLCIVTPEQEIFIRGDNKEIINGWSEQLSVYLRTNKQNQKKKRKVEPVASQEPSPAKMAATDPAESSCGQWQEDQQQGRGLTVSPLWPVRDLDPPQKTPAGNTSTHLSPVSRDSPSLDGTVSSLDLVPGVNRDPCSKNHMSESDDKNQSRDAREERMLGAEDTRKEEDAVGRKGRSEARSHTREKLQSCGDIAQLAAPPPQRRARSLDRRTSDTVMTPDLLNFKKGWMVKLDEKEQWKKYWFVLSADSLRFYKDSMAEEASDLEGEIDLTKCLNVSEYQVQRNYGFQIQTPKGVFTLSAMTAGIRRNWIQALMKNVHPAKAPDVTSLPGLHNPCSPPEALPKPDVAPDPPEKDPQPKHKSVTERRREGRNKTFDWAEFRHQRKKTGVDVGPQRTKALSSLEFGDLERRKRREERRKRYESMLGFSLGWEEDKDKSGDIRPLSPRSQLRVEKEIEQCWRLVETTVFRLETSVPLFPDAKDSEERERLLDGYRTGLEDLKAQLAESELRRLELETQLKTAGRNQQQLEPPLSPDANEKMLNSRTQTLKDTTQLLHEKNVISSEPLSLTLQTPSIWLHDTEGNLHELDDFTSPLISPTSDGSDIFLQTDEQSVDLHMDAVETIKTNQQNQKELGRGDGEQTPVTETQTNNDDYTPLILEKSGGEEDLSFCVENDIPPDQTVLRRLSQEVELLTSQNEALNQRNQEMLNQLTEADREIERLKTELSGRYLEPHHLPEVEKLGQARLDDVQMELGLKNQQLLEAQTLILSLEENLKETEALLQLNTPAEGEETEQEKREIAEREEGYLLRCLEAAEAKLTELERQIDQTKEEKEEVYLQTSAEEEEEDEEEEGRGSEERIQEVIEGMMIRLKALGKLLEVMDKFEISLRKDKRNDHDDEEEVKASVVTQLKWEEEFWSFMLDKLESNLFQQNEKKPVEGLSEMTNWMLTENQIMLLGCESSSEEEQDALKDLDIICSNSSEQDTENTEERRIMDSDKQPREMKHFRAITEMKMNLLNAIATSGKLHKMNIRLADSPSSGLIVSAATEAMYCCRISQLHAKYERELEETKQKLLNSSLVCSRCVHLMEENRELRETLTHLEEKQAEESGEKINVSCQTEDTDIKVEKDSTAEEIVEEDVAVKEETSNSVLQTFCCDNGESGIQEAEDENTEKSEASETEELLGLRRKVMELEEQLSLMRAEDDGKLSSIHMQHEKEMEKLKVTCELGLASMEESHLKGVEELQRRHQQEVQRLLVDRDRLLEEESAATATAIEAIKNAHRLELEREVQRRCRSENTHLDDVYRQHSEELESFQRELQVLSQQFALKCLENGHLVQAVDAERKALCQCQQENQDLRTRNQELSGHLAAEITRLCSVAKQDDLPLSQGMDVYQMEITLRVKESEVQCLKQEIKSLKDELLSAQKDKRNATKKYKDVLTELSITRAKTEREVEELRENLRLAHCALHHASS